MLKTYSIIPSTFILFLFGLTLITVSSVFAADSPEVMHCKQIQPMSDPHAQNSCLQIIQDIQAADKQAGTRDLKHYINDTSVAEPRGAEEEMRHTEYTQTQPPFQSQKNVVKEDLTSHQKTTDTLIDNTTPNHQPTRLDPYDIPDDPSLNIMVPGEGTN